MAAARRDGCPADALPEPVLGLIFAHCGREHSSDISLVCRRWRRALLAEPALWSKQRLARGSLHDLPLQEQLEWLASKRRLLAATAPVTTCLEVLRAGGIRSWPPPSGAATGSQLAALLRALRRAPLIELTLACGAHKIEGQYSEERGTPDQLCGLPCLPAAALRVLPRFAELTALSLQSWQLPACTAAVLLQLPQLRSLQCAAREVLPSVADSMIQLTALTRLELRVAVALPPLAGLTRLQKLQELVLVCENERLSVAPLPPPSAFPDLQRYHLICTVCSFFNEGNDPLVQVSGVAPVTRCECDTSDCFSILRMRLHSRLGPPGALQRLLTSLLPRKAPRLIALTLLAGDWATDEDTHAVLPALRGCSALAPLRVLHLLCGTSAHACSSAVLAALLEQAPELQELSLDGCRELPACVINYYPLQCLNLHGCRLADLPTGPYLAGLEELTLDVTVLGRLPPALLQTTRLHTLCFPSAYAPPAALRITRADVDGVLLRMPWLQRLDLTGATLSPAMAIYLARAMPWLVIRADGDQELEQS
ncbi:hypothetical protein ABPG75_009352 [Micractinium tetrahymenae]